MLPLSFLFACNGTDLPLDTWRIVGENELGVIRHSRSGWRQNIEIALFTTHASTSGLVQASLDEDMGTAWLRFPIETAFGEGEASIRLQGKEAYLPLGARMNEFGIRMQALQGADVSDDEIVQAQAVWRSRQAEDHHAWMQGSFVLYSDVTPVGTVQFIPDSPAEISVFDSFWLSEGVVQAERLDEGGDILLLFPVEPSLEGEDALLRINTILLEAVVPTADVPSDLDRRLQLKPGVMDQNRRDELMDNAITEANRLEKEVLRRDGVQLAQWAVRTAGCASFDDWVMNSGYDWLGYRVKIEAVDDECVVLVESDPEQHRRRFSGKITRNGIIVAEIGE